MDKFKNKKILVTGGMGYIGSHTVVQLLQAGAKAVILDNLSNSKIDVIERIERITGARPEFCEGDIRDRRLVRHLFEKDTISAVIHFAGLKVVNESIAKPLEYYDNNVAGTLVLLEEAQKAGVRDFVFSSSANVYGNAASVPITEEFPLQPTNPYGRSKMLAESILRDLYRSDNAWKIAILRYFNPVGAHESGLLGENPNGMPNNLLPYIARVASGAAEYLAVYGDDYSTPDGTGVRDYIHVDDLAKGHLAALDALQNQGSLFTLNLGTGRGYSVLEMIRAFEKASDKKVPFKVGQRRSGDVAQSFADVTMAKQVLGWSAGLDVDRMCLDAWRWQSNQMHAS